MYKCSWPGGDCCSGYVLVEVGCECSSCVMATAGLTDTKVRQSTGVGWVGSFLGMSHGITRSIFLVISQEREWLKNATCTYQKAPVWLGVGRMRMGRHDFLSVLKQKLQTSTDIQLSPLFPQRWGSYKVRSLCHGSMFLLCLAAWHLCRVVLPYVPVL